MIETLGDSKMSEKANSVIAHLEMESQFLDFVIESSLEMQSLLRDRQTFQSVPLVQPTDRLAVDDEAVTNRPKNDQNERLKSRLAEIRQQIARQFQPVIEGRRNMVEIMNSITPNRSQPPSVTALTLKIDEPFRGRLKQLRNEIRLKLNQVQSISMGSQAVLLYTMDFYNRLLTGLTKDQTRSSYYNSMGRTHNRSSVNFVETNC